MNTKKLLLAIFLFAYGSTIALALPVANFTFTNSGGGSTGCIPDTVNFINTSTGAISYRWDFGDFSPKDFTANPTHIYTSSGTFVVKLVAVNGSDSTIKMKVVNIQSNVFAWFNPINNPGCLGEETKFNVTAFGVTNYFWDFGDGQTSLVANPNHTYSGTGTYTITLIAYNSCTSDTVIQPVTIDNNAQPTANFSPGSYTVCPGEPVTFSNYSSNLTNASWDFGDGNTSTAISPVHVYASAGSFTAKLIVANTCTTDTFQTVIAVNNSLVPVVSGSGAPTPVCAGDKVNFYASSAGLKSLLWDFKDGNVSVLPTVSHVYTSNGTYNVLLTETNYCNNTATQTIVIKVNNIAVPTASFSRAPWGDVCPNNSIYFTNYTVGTVTSLWNFGDGNTSTLANPVHSYNIAATYTVSLKVTNLCGKSNTMTNVVTVSNGILPTAGFQILPGGAPPALACPGDTVRFQNWSSDTTNCSWDFGDGTTSTLVTPTHTYASIGDYSVLLTVTNSCGGTAGGAQPISITASAAAPSANNANVYPQNLCPGNSINYNYWSMSGTVNAFWDFGDGSSSNMNYGNHQYVMSGNYFVTLIVSNNCGSDTATFNIVVKNGVTAMLNTTNVCSGSAATFTDLSTGTPANWLWNFGDGNTSTAQNPVHTYLSTGTYNVTLSVSDGVGCSDTTSGTISVLTTAPVSINVSASASTICGAGTNVTFTAAAVNGGASPVYQWKLNGINVGINSPAYSNSSWSNGDLVKCVITSSLACATSSPATSNTITMTVYPLPFANAGSDVTIIAGGSTVLSGSGGTTYLWSPAGSLSCSTCASPIATPGITTTYVVVVTDSNGCQAMDSVTVTVIPTGISAVNNGVEGFSVYPNPINFSAVITYHLQKNATVELVVLDIMGNELKIYPFVQQDAGVHKQIISISELQMANGIYMIRLKTEGQSLYRKVSVIR